MKRGFAARGVIALLIAGVAGCSQPESRSEASAIVDVEGDKTTVQTVEIRGFGGFTGSYWPGGEPANAYLHESNVHDLRNHLGRADAEFDTGPGHFQDRREMLTGRSERLKPRERGRRFTIEDSQEWTR